MMIYDEIYSFFQSDKRIVIREGDTLAELKLLPSDTFRLAVSSPPYNIGKEYEKQVDLKHYLDWQLEIIRELYRIVSDNRQYCLAGRQLCRGWRSLSS